jgi:signal transduction histidine kinase
VRIWVTDNGKGLPPGFDLERDAGTGLGNTRARIQRLYGNGASLALGSPPGGGTTVELSLPRAPLVAALSA